MLADNRDLVLNIELKNYNTKRITATLFRKHKFHHPMLILIRGMLLYIIYLPRAAPSVESSFAVNYLYPTTLSRPAVSILTVTQSGLPRRTLAPGTELKVTMTRAGTCASGIQQYSVNTITIALRSRLWRGRVHCRAGGAAGAARGGGAAMHRARAAAAQQARHVRRRLNGCSVNDSRRESPSPSLQTTFKLFRIPAPN